LISNPENVEKSEELPEVGTKRKSCSRLVKRKGRKRWVLLGYHLIANGKTKLASPQRNVSQDNVFVMQRPTVAPKTEVSIRIPSTLFLTTSQVADLKKDFVNRLLDNQTTLSQA